MAITVLFNGVTYSVPETGDEAWGEQATAYLVAIPQGCLQKTGGTFSLTADVNFGANYGLLSKYFSTRTASPASAGIVRLAKTDSIGWRNNAGGGDLLLAINGSDQLTFGGTAIYPAGITALTGDVTATGPGSVAATIAAGAIVDSKVNASAAIALTKLASILTGSFVGRVTAGTGAIENISATQATSLLDLFSTTLKGLVPPSVTADGTKFLRDDGVFATPTGAGDVVGPASSTNGNLPSFNGTTGKLLQDSGKLAADVVTGPASAVDAEFSLFNSTTGKIIKRASGTGIARAASGVSSFAELSGDVTTSGSNAATIANDAVTNAKAANMATQTIKGRTTAGTGDPEDLTPAQAAAIISVAPTVQRFTSGSTYTTPTSPRSPLYIVVEMVGPGGGGGGGGTSQGAGNNGSADTTFDNWTAGKGSGSNGNSGGAGGTNTTGTGTLVYNLVGADGESGSASAGASGVNVEEPNGAVSFFGGSGAGAAGSSSGGNAKANTGSGGGAGGSGNLLTNGAGGGSGGAGGYLKFMKAAPASSYSIGIGAGGSGGSGSHTNGGSGADGIIIVTEYYQ